MTLETKSEPGRLIDTPMRRPKLYEVIVERVETMIANAELSPGETLPSERGICAQFGVGRTVVREAFVALQRRGMIVISSGERARVALPTPDRIVSEMTGVVRLLLTEPRNLEHFQDLRSMFETSLAREAARTATDDDIARLAAALSANRDSIDDPAKFAATDVAFHDVIAGISRNPLASAINTALGNWLHDQRIIGLRAPGAARSAYDYHAAIHDAIARKDPIAAEMAMADHLQNVKTFYAVGQAVNGARPEPR